MSRRYAPKQTGTENVKEAPRRMRPARPFSRLLKAFRLKSARLLIIATLVTIGAGLSWFEPPFILQAREWVWDEMVRVKPRAWEPGVEGSHRQYR